MDEEDYGDIADEDLIEAFSQPSQPLLSKSLSPHPRKRRRVSETTDDEVSIGPRCNSRDSVDASDSEGEEGDGKSAKKKKKYKIHEGVEQVPGPRILEATQAEALPDSSPAYKIRGPIYRKPRLEVPKPPTFTVARQTTTPQTILKTLTNNIPNSKNDDLARELNDLPDDAFFSSLRMFLDPRSL